MLQALSVLAMVCLHLFCTFDYSDKFTPIFFVAGVPVCFYIAQFCDFCVFGFAFCSGYGHMAQYGQPDYYSRRMKGLLSVLIEYWTVLAVFSIVSIAVGQADYMPGSISKFLITATTFGSAYNGAWWYMFVYVVLCICSPIILKAVKKVHPAVILVVGIVIYSVAYYVRFSVHSSNWILLKFGPLGMAFFEYLLGAIFYKSQILSFIYRYWDKIRKPVRNAASVQLLLAMLYGHTKVIGSLFVAPITGIIIFVLFHFWSKPKWIEQGMLFIGNHSTNIWLTHMFFYLVMFKGFVYKAKYPLLIYIFMLLVTISVSMLLKLIQEPLQRALVQR